MNSIEIKRDLYWVGVKNPDLRIFDIVMRTEKGTTYNSYLIVDEKVALIDTVKDGYYDEFKEKVKGIIGDRKIDYLIVQHTEPDHSGSVRRVIEDYEGITVYGSRASLINLKNITHIDFNGIEAKGELNIGKRTLSFISAPLLHWPDTIFTYDEYDKVLFTCDGFGCHYCGESMFNDVDGEGYERELKYYYDVIMGPFKKNILSAIEKIRPLNIEVIATSHGPILRKDPFKIVDKYEMWSRELKIENRALILYVSAYGYTRKLAEAIYDGVKEAGALADIADLSQEDIGQLTEKLEMSKALAIGSPTINQDAVKPVWDFLSIVSPIRNRGKIAIAFGSYGWSGEGVPMLAERLKSLKFKVMEPLKVCFKPDKCDLEKAREIGLEIGRSILEK